VRGHIGLRRIGELTILLIANASFAPPPARFSAGEASDALASRVGEIGGNRRPPPGSEFAPLTQIPCAPLTPAKAEEVERVACNPAFTCA